jgi:predicted transcriptional regulator
MADSGQKLVSPPSDESEREVQQSKLNAAIAQGIADLEAGRSSDIETVARDLSARYAAWPTRKSA